MTDKIFLKSQSFHQKFKIKKCIDMHDAQIYKNALEIFY